ncbi:MAG: SPASM domain-containing protein, partial [Candidatus Sumerlaeota bacterium]|nr:SPASM domain-containing protein [Candidatus Sumerlaeota bacterium]
QIVVYPDGETLPCSELRNRRRFGNLERQNFREIFYGPAFRALREELRRGRPDPVCFACTCGQTSDLNDPRAFSSRPIHP